MRTIYCYHQEQVNNNLIALGKNPLFKIGATTIVADTPQEAAEKRMKQQDTTSCAESLILDFAEAVKEDFMPNVKETIDKEFHKWLRKKNIYKYRKNANREWFNAFKNAEEVKSYLHEFLNNAHAPNNWQMRTSQKLAHDKIVNYFLNNKGSEFLLAAKMRFGKNFTFLNAIKTLGFKNILVITYKPAVFESLEYDITSHINFINSVKYITYKNERNKLILDDSKINIVSCSAQMAGYTYKENMLDDEIIEYNNKIDLKKNLENLAKIKWDLIITDECHYGANTPNFKNICDILNCNKILYISGTPFKTIGNFADNALYMYTYLDEQNDPENKGMAKLYQYGIKMDTKLIEMYKKLIEIVDYPTMSKIFQCTGTEFTYPEVAKATIDDIINRGIRQSGMENIKHMFILFNNIAACVAATNYINEQYNKTFLGINCGGGSGVKTVGELKEYISEAINLGKGSITCSCGRFIEGVTIKEWNAVIMCHDGTSPERYFQAMFRAQTPAEGKDKFYVIDYNPERLLNLNYQFISLLPTGKKSLYNNTREDNIKQWLKATKIIVTENDSDQTQREIDYIELERTFFEGGKDINMFTNNYVYNRIQYIKQFVSQESCNNIMSNFKKISGVLNKDCKINDNELYGGKNKVPYTSASNNNKKSKNKQSNEFTISDIIAAVKNNIKYISKFLLVYKCHSLEDIINKLHTNNDKEIEYFENMIGINVNLFIDIATVYNIINSEGFKYICDEFWEQHKLHYENTKSAKDRYKFGINWNLFK